MDTTGTYPGIHIREFLRIMEIGIAVRNLISLHGKNCP